jgi:hypothetical protein
MSDIYVSEPPSVAYPGGRRIQLPIQNLEQTFNWNVDGTLNYISVTYNTTYEYRQTFTYTDGDLTSISPWEYYEA